MAVPERETEVCYNCDIEPIYAKAQCEACYRYYRRTGNLRPYHVIQRAEERKQGIPRRRITVTTMENCEVEALEAEQRVRTFGYRRTIRESYVRAELLRSV